MAKLCECCGNKNNSFGGDPLYLSHDKILCYKCTEPIRDELNQLYYVKNKEEFDELKISIIGKSKVLFNDNIINYISLIINKRCADLGFSVESKDIENIIPIFNSNNRKATTITSKSEEKAGMFESIGRKIKTLVRIVTWISIIACVICGISMALSDDDLICTMGVLLMIIGPLVSWISSFMIYGFGQLIDNTDKIVELLKK